MNRIEKIQALHDAFNLQSEEAMKRITGKVDEERMERILLSDYSKMPTEQLIECQKYICAKMGIPYISLESLNLTVEEMRERKKELENELGK